MSQRDEAADVLTKVLHATLGAMDPDDMVDLAKYPNERAVLGETLAQAVAAAGLLVPPSPALPFDLDASTLRIFAQALMEDGEWNGIVHTLNGWASFLDTQETPQ